MSGATTLIDRSVVVVGGGVMGTSTAYHLARSGVTDVTLLEAGELASGSSGKPLGGVRAQFSDPANIALGQRSLEAFRRFGTEPGADIGLQQVGYLFALRDAGDVAGFESSTALQRAMGVRVEMVEPAEARRLCPYLAADTALDTDTAPAPDPDTHSLVAAVWAPDSGHARPGQVVHGYADAAAALGVEIRTGTPVTGLEEHAGRALLTTADGTRYRTPTVVCAAGAWSRALAAQVGVDLPITPLRRQIAFTPALPGRPPRLPFTIDYGTTAYLHGAEDGGLLLGWADPDQAPGEGTGVSTGWHAGLRRALRVFAPALAEVPIVSGWAGLYEMTPDRNALIGEAGPGFRFLYAAGFSGHGFLQGPAVGECVADLYRGREPVVDVSAFDARRFERGAVRTELAII